MAEAEDQPWYFGTLPGEGKFTSTAGSSMLISRAIWFRKMLHFIVVGGNHRVQNPLAPGQDF